MSKIILTEIELGEVAFGSDIQIVHINGRSVKKYEGNSDVIAIIGCRATARIVINMNFPGLKIYQLTSAGFDGIPANLFADKDIWLCNAGDVYSVPIAETVIYGMLQYSKRYWNNPKYHFLRPARGYKYIQELHDKKMLVMGCGRIGTAVAARAAAFGMEIHGYDPYLTQKDEYEEIYTSKMQLVSRLSLFDYIVTTIPLSEETKGFFNDEIFNAMKQNAVIINVGRRGIFDEHSFYRALKQKKIQGAVLDMFEKIPNPFTNPFRRLSNTIVLPGVSAISRETRMRLKIHICDNINKILNNEKPRFIVN